MTEPTAAAEELQIEENDGSINNINVSNEDEGGPVFNTEVIHRVLQKKPKYDGLKATEDNIEEIVLDAISDGYELNLSGVHLVEEMPFFLIDSLTRNGYNAFSHIDLSYCKLSTLNFNAIIDVIANFNRLQVLKFQGNELGKESGFSITKILSSTGKLQILDCSHNSLQDQGLSAIGGSFNSKLESIPSNRPVSLCSLTVLDLTDNKFGDHGLMTLCRGFSAFFKSCTVSGRVSHLQSLRLGHNNFGDDGLSCLSSLLERYYMSGLLPLEHLDVSHSRATDKSLCELLRLIGDVPPKYSTLMKLEMGNCSIGIDTIRHVTRSVGRTSSARLRYVDLAVPESDARKMLNNEDFTDVIVQLSDAVGESSELAVLHLGDLVSIVRQEAIRCDARSGEYIRLRIVLDSLRSMMEVLQLSAQQQHLFLSSLGSGQPPSVLQRQKVEFEKRRKENKAAWKSLGEDILDMENLVGSSGNSDLVSHSANSPARAANISEDVAVGTSPIRSNTPNNSLVASSSMEAELPRNGDASTTDIDTKTAQNDAVITVASPHTTNSALAQQPQAIIASQPSSAIPSVRTANISSSGNGPLIPSSNLLGTPLSHRLDEAGKRTDLTHSQLSDVVQEAVQRAVSSAQRQWDGKFACWRFRFCK